MLLKPPLNEVDHYKKGSFGRSGQNIFLFLLLPPKQAVLFPHQEPNNHGVSQALSTQLIHH